MKLPDGYKANVYPRSSTYNNFGIVLANGVCQIDNSYSGNEDQWMFPAIALRDTVINKNNRICQFEIQKIQSDLEFIEVENLDAISRGGIGSTGERMIFNKYDRKGISRQGITESKGILRLLRCRADESKRNNDKNGQPIYSTHGKPIICK